jgi:hypothetical protein
VTVPSISVLHPSRDANLTAILGLAAWVTYRTNHRNKSYLRESDSELDAISSLAHKLIIYPAATDAVNSHHFANINDQKLQQLVLDLLEPDDLVIILET